jgi:predicted TPR repeat methyltransferase
MDLTLPSPQQVLALLPKWRVEHPHLETMLERYGEPVNALRHIGVLYWREGDPVAAELMFAGAVALAPDQASLWSNLGGVLVAIGHRGAAARCLENAVARDASRAGDWLLLGTILSNEPDKSRAEEAFLSAIERNPASADAALGLGLLYIQVRRYEQAAHFLNKAIANGTQNDTVYLCLGQVLSSLGDFSGSARAFAEAVRRAPGDDAVKQKYGQARFLETLLSHTASEAFAAYREAAGREPEDSEKFARNAFHMLSGFGHTEAAIRLGETIRKDSVLTYLLSAVKQEPLSRAPEDYITSYFDKFAETFDRQLVEALGYRCPEQLYAIVVTEAARQRVPISRIVDLGCGTGLAGPLLARFGGSLTGVDLSRGMLAKARERAVYDSLVSSEVVAYLEAQPEEAFDLVFAADVLIYIGDLAPLIAHVARVLAPGRFFALSIEQENTSETFQILPSGRFAHQPAYVLDLCRGSFILRHREPTILRLEAGKPVEGMLMLFERV